MLLGQMPERMEDWICDFCSTQPVYAEYPCADFTDQLAPILGSCRAWIACRTCYELIQADKWNKLARRSAKRFAQVYGFSPAYAYEHHRQLHAKFREFRTGPPKVARCPNICSRRLPPTRDRAVYRARGDHQHILRYPIPNSGRRVAISAVPAVRNPEAAKRAVGKVQPSRPALRKETPCV
jgi:hypothetical protein